METTTIRQTSTPRTALLSSGIVAGLIGMQVAFMPWIIVTVLNWSTDDMLEENIALYLLLLALILSPLMIPLVVKLSRLPRFATFCKNWLVYIGLAGQALLDWLIYAKFHGMFPFSSTLIPGGTGSAGAGWLSTDNEPMVLLAAWLNWSLLVVVPALLCSFLGTMPRGNGMRSSLHLGGTIAGAFMALQWGGTWSLSFNHLLWILTLVAMLSIVQDRASIMKHEGDPAYLPVFSTMGIAFMLGFWASIVLVQSSGSPATAWTWFAFGVASAVLFLISIKRPGIMDSIRGRRAVAIAWIGSSACTMLVVMANLNSWFASFAVLWQCIGLAGISVFPELLALKTRAGTMKTGARIFFAAIFFVAGIIATLVPNLYDPITSYAAFALLGLPIIMSFTIAAPPRKQGVRA
jgi:hypothetical protein